MSAIPSHPPPDDQISHIEAASAKEESNLSTPSIRYFIQADLVSTTGSERSWPMGNYGTFTEACRAAQDFIESEQATEVHVCDGSGKCYCTILPSPVK